MKCKSLLLLMLAAMSIPAAQIKDVRFGCDANGCQMNFQFSSDKNLPSFFQKYDASSHQLLIGFSETDFALGEGLLNIDNGSGYIRSMRIFKEPYRGMNFLKIQMDVGGSVSSDKNPISLKGSNFSLKFSGPKAKSWTLSKLFADRKKAADKAAAQVALDEKKAAAEEKKAMARAAAEEKKRLAEEKKAAARASAEEKKALARAAAEEKKRMLEEKKMAEKMALEERKAAALAAKEQKKQQELMKKAMAQGGGVSALLPNLKEMTVLIGSGLEQFRLVADTPIEFSVVSNVDRSYCINVGIEGPNHSPVFKVAASSMVKSVAWSDNGLKIQLVVGANPTIMVKEGALILQNRESAVKRDGFVFWSARPDGIYVRDWMRVSEERSDFESFAKKYDDDGKKLISASQTFFLHPVVRELIVVADETEFYAAPSENAQVLQRVVFGDRLVNMDMSGLYRKVQFGGKVGYVNKRAVSFNDELSPVQSERLKQVDKDRNELGSMADKASTSQLESFYDDRVTYSSFGRRDPFVEIKGLVEEGINIDQVELVGIIWEADVPLAILVESKNPAVSYTLKEGDKIMNGKVLKITQTDVLFLIQEFGVSRRYSMSLPDKFGGQK